LFAIQSFRVIEVTVERPKRAARRVVLDLRESWHVKPHSKHGP